jgi:hypothetical protein
MLGCSCNAGVGEGWDGLQREQEGSTGESEGWNGPQGEQEDSADIREGSTGLQDQYCSSCNFGRSGH